MEFSEISTEDAPGEQAQGVVEMGNSTDSEIHSPFVESCQENPFLAAALAYAAQGFPIYPAREADEPLEAFVQRTKHLPEAERKRQFRRKAKSPYIRDWNNAASTDPEIIRGWWGRWPGALLGLATGERAGLFVLDSDKPDGESTVAALEELYGPLPATLTVRSGKGGTHRYFRWPTDGRIVPSSEGQLGVNLDVRGHGGGIILPPSLLPAAFLTYEFVGDPETPIAEMPPAWLDAVAKDASIIREREGDGVPLVELDTPENVERGQTYLVEKAPEAVQGTGQHRTTYAVAAKLREMGLSQDTTFELMAEHYNDQKCSPPWDLSSLEYQVDCAFRYAKSPWGGDTPEGAFAGSPTDDVLFEAIEKSKKTNPNVIDELNENHAFTVIASKACIVRENVLVDSDSEPLTLMNERAFALKYGTRYVTVKDGDKIGKDGRPKMKQIGAGRFWLGHPRRRAVEGIGFFPHPRKAPEDYINLYRGAYLKPTEKPEPDRCAKYVNFIQEIICNGDTALFKYVLAWIADAVQKPGGRKPGVCLVLRGGQGTGKGTFAEYLSKLFAPYSITLDRPDQLVGKFNGHMANKLFVVADEAFWAGDRSKIGPLKSFITESKLSYEWKGRDVTMMDSYHRVIMLSNNDWVVPADIDDRRFAVLDVSSLHATDSEYFGAIRHDMDNGGLEAFYRMMLDHDYSDVNVMMAPKTQGLLDQKLESMDEIGSFVLDMLMQGKVMLNSGVVSDSPWPEWVHKEELYNAFGSTLAKDRERYKPKAIVFGRKLRRYMPGVNPEAKGPMNERGERPRVFALPPLIQARADFDRVIGQPMAWPA